MDEWEALWETQRAAIVKRIKDNKWGLQADGKTVVGPGRLPHRPQQVSSTGATPRASPTPTIKMNGTVAQSGTFADSANVAKGMGVVYDYYGAKGFFTDSTGKNRKINWAYKDDGYDPARTVPLVAEILDSEHAFTIWTLGTPST